jgi:type II restriction/modification system DNA methylase subunit YeeA
MYTCCTFTLTNARNSIPRGSYIRLSDFRGSENQAPKALQAINNPDCGWFFNASATDFKKIQGSPIAYWVNERIFDLFGSSPEIGNVSDARVGLQTSDNERFLRYWSEVAKSGIFMNAGSRSDAKKSEAKWFPCNKGGEFRKCYGNQYYVVNWENDGLNVREFRDESGRLLSRPQNVDFYFREAISWSDVTSSANAFRYFPTGFINDATAHSAFGGDFKWKMSLIVYCNNKFVNLVARILNPTMHFHIGYFNKLPYAELAWTDEVAIVAQQWVALSEADWDSYETSWKFKFLPLLQSYYRQQSMQEAYTKVRAHWQDMTQHMQRLEEENNRIFIEAYGLQDERTPEVPLSEITLTCNPHYRYGGNKNEEELESLLLADTMKELISYAIGCMMGRYSLDDPGLIYAHSENVGFDPSKYSSFPADDDGIIPIMDMDWFPDDATYRFVQFLTVAWSPETLEENLKFVAESLSPKRGETPVETIRHYLSTGFFKDHLKTYKKRPIYWLFSSGKNKAFECLVYLHRYNEATLSRMRSSYVTPLQGKLNARIEYLRNEVRMPEPLPHARSSYRN